MSVSVVLADDHPIVRKGIRTYLETQTGIQILGEYNDGFSAMEDIQRLRPDIAILDISMPGLPGSEIARRIKETRLPTRTIILSIYSDERQILNCLKSGASGYVSKDSTPSDLVEAIYAVNSGKYYLPRELVERAIQMFIIRSKENAELDDLQTLTHRERDILFLLAEGQTNREIAERLTISPRTVEIHRSNLMHKLGLTNQLELIRFCFDHNILPL